MLQHISTKIFIEGIVLFVAIYYVMVAVMYYPKDIKKWLHRIRFKNGKG